MNTPATQPYGYDLLAERLRFHGDDTGTSDEPEYEEAQRRAQARDDARQAAAAARNAWWWAEYAKGPGAWSPEFAAVFCPTQP